RLQCYEGIDAHQALYEWDYTRQLLYARLLQEGRELREDAADEIFGPRFLVERPLLQAVRAGDRAVLLVDEIDRADDEFEAFLLEMLSDFQVTVPELGTIRAARPPAVVLTSNRTRELHDALKRRCLYHWIDYPSLDREVEILAARAPTVPADLARRVAAAVDRIRTLDLVKAPGVAETIEWAKALAFLGVSQLERDSVDVTLGAVVKDHDDLVRIREDLERILADVGRRRRRHAGAAGARRVRTGVASRRPPRRDGPGPLVLSGALPPRPDRPARHLLVGSRVPRLAPRRSLRVRQCVRSLLPRGHRPEDRRPSRR